MNIATAEINDLPIILTLQKLAYQSEAQLVNDFSIPPLTQTLESITDDFNSGIILKAALPSKPNEIVGSVRGRVVGSTLFIGRLIAHPSFQGQGIGTALLSRIESLYPDKRYELFTSDRSSRNLSLYMKIGYREFKREPLNESVYFVFLEKNGLPNHE